MKIIARNKKAFFHYEILNKYEAGIVLTGSEIKAIRSGNVVIQDSYIIFKDNEAYIINMNISNYKFSTAFQVDPVRRRKLLLNYNEIIKIQHEQKTKNLVIISLSLYLNFKGLAKLEIALAKPKKVHDKREDIKQRDLKRQIKNNY